jgi:hypothetical protein
METPRSRQKIESAALRESRSFPPPSFLLFLLPFSFWIIAIIQLHHNRKKAYISTKGVGIVGGKELKPEDVKPTHNV